MLPSRKEVKIGDIMEVIISKNNQPEETITTKVAEVVEEEVVAIFVLFAKSVVRHVI